MFQVGLSVHEGHFSKLDFGFRLFMLWGFGEVGGGTSQTLNPKPSRLGSNGNCMCFIQNLQFYPSVSQNLQFNFSELAVSMGYNNPSKNPQGFNRQVFKPSSKARQTPPPSLHTPLGQVGPKCRKSNKQNPANPAKLWTHRRCAQSKTQSSRCRKQKKLKETSAASKT